MRPSSFSNRINSSSALSSANFVRFNKSVRSSPSLVESSHCTICWQLQSTQTDIIRSALTALAQPPLSISFKQQTCASPL